MQTTLIYSLLHRLNFILSTSDMFSNEGQILERFSKKCFRISSIAEQIGPVTLFQNLELGKASTIWQSLGPNLVNINVYAKFYQNIPHGSRVMSNFHKLIWHGHTISKTDHGQLTQKLKEQEFSFLALTHFLVRSFIKLSCTVQVSKLIYHGHTRLFVKLFDTDT